MGRRPNEALGLIWKRRVAEQGRSPLSIAEFCGQEGVSAKSFYVWRKRLRSDAGSKSRRGAGGGGGAAAAAARQGRPGSRLFVPIHLPPGSLPVGGVRIEFPSGAVLTLPTEASAELLTAVIGAVMSRASNAEPPSC
jgi:hypothetical protein